MTQWHEFHAPKLTNFHIFIIRLPFNVTLYSESPYLTIHIKTNYETDNTGRFFEKKQRDISRTIATAKMLLFVALFNSFQHLTNFRKNHKANELFKLFKWLLLYLIPYKLKYSTASNVDSLCLLGISSYLAKQTLLTSKFSGSCWGRGVIYIIMKGHLAGMAAAMGKVFETVVFRWDSELREEVSFYFSRVFSSIHKSFVLGGGLKTSL